MCLLGVALKFPEPVLWSPSGRGRNGKEGGSGKTLKLSFVRIPHYLRKLIQSSNCMKCPSSIASLLLVLPLGLAANLGAQTASTPSTTPPNTVTLITAATSAVSLELPRVKTRHQAGDLPPVPPGKFSTYELLPDGVLGASSATKQNFKYLSGGRQRLVTPPAGAR
jgi:hypothetical protein